MVVSAADAGHKECNPTYLLLTASLPTPQPQAALVTSTFSLHWRILHCFDTYRPSFEEFNMSNIRLVPICICLIAGLLVYSTAAIGDFDTR
jgi:hypothetical protein